MTFFKLATGRHFFFLNTCVITRRPQATCHLTVKLIKLVTCIPVVYLCWLRCCRRKYLWIANILVSCHYKRKRRLLSKTLSRCWTHLKSQAGKEAALLHLSWFVAVAVLAQEEGGRYTQLSTFPCLSLSLGDLIARYCPIPWEQFHSVDVSLCTIQLQDWKLFSCKSSSRHIKLDTFLRRTYNICRMLPSIFMNYLGSSLSSPFVLFDSKETTVVHKTFVKWSYEIHSQNLYCFVLLNECFISCLLISFLLWTSCWERDTTVFSVGVHLGYSSFDMPVLWLHVMELVKLHSWFTSTKCKLRSLVPPMFVLPCAVDYCWYNGLSQEMPVGTELTCPLVTDLCGEPSWKLSGGDWQLLLLTWKRGGGPSSWPS